jgi:tetratricopeptide (TPR) repeat protein
VATEVRQLIQQGTAAFEAGEYAEADRLLREVVERAPTYANVYNMLGLIASHRGAPEKAIEWFRQALTLNPNYSEVQLNLAITLADMGAYEQAAQEAGKVQEREPGTAGHPGLGVKGKLANAHADLARKYHLLGMYAEAIGEYDKALGLCPNFPDIHNRRAVSCREFGDYAGAKESLLRALELKPNYVEAHVNLGLLHQKSGNPAGAIAAWERALSFDPTHRLARIYLTQATPRTAGG